MNSIREATHNGEIDPILKELVPEAAANLRARHRGVTLTIEGPHLQPEHETGGNLRLPVRRIFDGPKYDGKECAVCQRHFKSSAEYVTCRLCSAFVCRRKHECKRLHHAEHHVAAKRAQKEGAA